MTRAGMTLLELTVGLTVTALAATVGWATLATLGDHRWRERDATAATVRAAAVRRAVVGWLEGAHATGEPQAPSFQLVDRTYRGRPDDELQFLTSALTPVGDGDVLVRLFIDRDGRTREQGLTAELIDWRRGQGRRMELDSSVVALDVRCLSDLLGRREWMHSWVSAVLLPRGVELRLTAATPERLVPLLRLPVTVAVEGGQ